MTAETIAAKARLVAELAVERGCTVAAAESLTSGHLASALGEAPDASVWFRGAVVAYAEAVKFDVLGVTPGPVITASCASEMASGVLDLLAAGIAVAVTGVGGPGRAEGVPSGTVFVALSRAGGVTECAELHFPGPPEVVVRRATEACLDNLLRGLSDR